eukprot:gene882-511_t
MAADLFEIPPGVAELLPPARRIATRQALDLLRATSDALGLSQTRVRKERERILLKNVHAVAMAADDKGFVARACTYDSSGSSSSSPHGPAQPLAEIGALNIQHNDDGEEAQHDVVPEGPTLLPTKGLPAPDEMALVAIPDVSAMQVIPWVLPAHRWASRAWTVASARSTWSKLTGVLLEASRAYRERSAGGTATFLILLCNACLKELPLGLCVEDLQLLLTIVEVGVGCGGLAYLSLGVPALLLLLLAVLWGAVCVRAARRERRRPSRHTRQGCGLLRRLHRWWRRATGKSIHDDAPPLQTPPRRRSNLGAVAPYYLAIATTTAPMLLLTARPTSLQNLWQAAGAGLWSRAPPPPPRPHSQPALQQFISTCLAALPAASALSVLGKKYFSVHRGCLAQWQCTTLFLLFAKLIVDGSFIVRRSLAEGRGKGKNYELGLFLLFSTICLYTTLFIFFFELSMVFLNKDLLLARYRRFTTTNAWIRMTNAVGSMMVRRWDACLLMSWRGRYFTLFSSLLFSVLQGFDARLTVFYVDPEHGNCWLKEVFRRTTRVFCYY